MIDLARVPLAPSSSPSLHKRPPPTSMSDGSELFPYLWRYFLSHGPLRDWLMRAAPFETPSLSPNHLANGIAFCCNFDVPPQWHDMIDAFDLGEMFVPDHAYSHFMCGSVVAATSYHKHLVCALGPAASRQPACQPSYRTTARRMVVDMGSSHSINIIEFSWMQDGVLIVTVKVLVAPERDAPLSSAGCTGAFALFGDVVPGGPMPAAPLSFVSFVEVPRCPVCISAGSLGCLCRCPPPPSSAPRSSALWPPRIATDLVGGASDVYRNVRIRLDLIHHMAQVKVTAHVVTSHVVPLAMGSGMSLTKYSLGCSRFIIKPVCFRPCNPLEADTLRQVADKLRLLRAAALRSCAPSLSRARRGGRGETLSESSRTTTMAGDVCSVSRDVTATTTTTTPAVTGGGASIAEANARAMEQCSAMVGDESHGEGDDDSSAHESEGGVSASVLRDAGYRGVGNGDTLLSSMQAEQTQAPLLAAHKMLYGPIDMSELRSRDEASFSGVTSSLLTTHGGDTRFGDGRCDEDDDEDDGMLFGKGGHENDDVLSMPTKRINCPKCDKTFSQQGSLNRHLKNIHEERKIPCEFCFMTFGQMFDLKRHQKRKHADKYLKGVRRDRIDAKAVRLPVAHLRT